MAKGGRWWCPGKDDHEAGFGSGAGGHRFSHVAAVWPPCPAPPRNCVYVEVDVAWWFAEQGVLLPWPVARCQHVTWLASEVLNQARVSVSAIPTSGHVLPCEILRRKICANESAAGPDICRRLAALGVVVRGRARCSVAERQGYLEGLNDEVDYKKGEEEQAQME
jgi:hypothetical protein